MSDTTTAIVISNDSQVESVTNTDNKLPPLKPKRNYSRRGVTNNPNGRPKGTTNKISGATILAAVERHSGQKFENLLAQGYVDSIREQDRVTRLQYEKMILAKVVADISEVEITAAIMPKINVVTPDKPKLK